MFRFLYIHDTSKPPVCQAGREIFYITKTVKTRVVLVRDSEQMFDDLSDGVYNTAFDKSQTDTGMSRQDKRNQK